MGSDLKAKIRLEGDSSNADKSIKKTEAGLSRLTSSVKAFARNTAVNFVAGTVAIASFVRGIRSAVEAAAEQEAAERALQAARGASIKSLTDQAAALQKLTTYGDEEIIRAQTLIASFVKEDDAIKAATKATLDLAAAKQMDLTAAADLVAKSLGSSTNALSRYGIEVTGAVGSTERLTSLTENIAKVFGGQAQAAVETFAGRMKQLKNVFGDVAEQIGFSITMNADFNESIKRVTTAFADAGPEIGAYTALLVKIGVEVFGGIIEKLNQVGTAIGKVVTSFHDLTNSSEDVEISHRALEETAKRLGITVEELNARIEGNSEARHRNIAATKEQTAAESANANAVSASAISQAELAAALKGTADAYAAAVDGASVFGEVTSVQLANQISEISLQLEVQKTILGEGSAEYERYASIGKLQIESLLERIENLRRGLGDLKDDTSDSADSLKDFGTNALDAAQQIDRLTQSNSDLATSMQKVANNGNAAGPAFSNQSALFPGLKGGTFTVVGRNIVTLPNGRIVVQ